MTRYNTPNLNIERPVPGSNEPHSTLLENAGWDKLDTTYDTLAKATAVADYRWVNSADQAAQTGMRAGDRGFREDNEWTYIYVGGKWQVWASDWTGYTPTLVSATLGNGSLSGLYRQDGETVHFAAKFLLGTTSIMAGGTMLGAPGGLPVSSVLSVTGQAWDIGGSTYPLVATPSGNNFATFAMDTAGAYAVIKQLGATAPFTWGVNDYLYVGGSYRTVWV